jgi:hypothetical protein
MTNNNDDTEFTHKLANSWTVPEISTDAKSRLLNAALPSPSPLKGEGTTPSPSPFKGEGRAEGKSEGKHNPKTHPKNNNARWYIASSALAAGLALMVFISSTKPVQNPSTPTEMAQLSDDELLNYVFATTTLEENN